MMLKLTDDSAQWAQIALRDSERDMCPCATNGLFVARYASSSYQPANPPLTSPGPRGSRVRRVNHSCLTTVDNCGRMTFVLDNCESSLTTVALQRVFIPVGAPFVQQSVVATC